MNPDTDSLEQHRQRSEFIRQFVQRIPDQQILDGRVGGVPRQIVQFWHDPLDVPKDVKECIDSWKHWEDKGFKHTLFDENQAKNYIGRFLDSTHVHAYGRCYHPAMQADYFRLCYLFVDGGLYVDADDICVSADIESLFHEGRLQAQPLCYDIDSGKMVTPSVFLRDHAFASNWIFYFNNNPLIANRGNAIIENALREATCVLSLVSENEFPEIQATTGPGNLSRSIFKLGSEPGGVKHHLVVLRHWEEIAVSRWPLDYRDDARNWRHSNRQRFGTSGF